VNTIIPSIFVFPWNNICILESYTPAKAFHPTEKACSISTMVE